MENQIDLQMINLQDFWKVLKMRIVPILLIAALGVGLFYGYNHYIVKPEYNSTATLYLLKQDIAKDYVYSQSDFSFSLSLMDDCTYMIKSHAVLDPVIEELDLNMGYRTLYNNISTSNPSGTRFLEVSVKTDDPEKSQAVADLLCDKASRNMIEEFGLDQVSVYSSATLEKAPCNTVGIRQYVMVGVGAGLLAYGLFFLIFIMDDKIKNEEDVKKYLELSVLSEIPNFEEGAKRGKHKQYYAYSTVTEEGEKEE